MNLEIEFNPTDNLENGIESLSPQIHHAHNKQQRSGRNGSITTKSNSSRTWYMSVTNIIYTSFNLMMRSICVIYNYIKESNFNIFCAGHYLGL